MTAIESGKPFQYGEYTIKPRHETGWYPEENNHGFWVVKNGCNIMPGACWFRTVRDAIEGIKKLELAEGNADLFWLLMGNGGLTTEHRTDGTFTVSSSSSKHAKVSQSVTSKRLTLKYGGFLLDLTPAEALATAAVLIEGAKLALEKK